MCGVSFPLAMQAIAAGDAFAAAMANNRGRSIVPSFDSSQASCSGQKGQEEGGEWGQPNECVCMHVLINERFTHQSRLQRCICVWWVWGIGHGRIISESIVMLSRPSRSACSTMRDVDSPATSHPQWLAGCRPWWRNKLTGCRDARHPQFFKLKKKRKKKEKRMCSISVNPRFCRTHF